MTAPDRCTVPGSPCRLQQLDQPGARPGWAALDAAGQRRLTGSLTLHLGPDVHVWFHEGRALFAERDGGPSPEQILLDAGVVTAAQLARGVIALGPVRNLGRLFDRVPELDPDVVELAIELATAELLGEVADRVADAVTVEPYRLHPSGLHHWATRPHEAPLAAAAQRVRDHSTAAPATPASPVPVEDDASVAVAATTATTRPVDEPVADRAVVEPPVPTIEETVTMVPVTLVPVPLAPVPPVPEPVADPHPSIDLRRVIEEVAAEVHAAEPLFGISGADAHDEPSEVSDDVRAAVRLALAEIAAATRPAVTDGLTVESLLGAGDAIRPDADPGDLDDPSDPSDDDHHGLRRLLGGRHT